jgi:hypothetical protein
MIIRIALRTPAGHILQKTFLGVTALVDPSTHVLQVLNRNKVVVAEYPSGTYLWWHKTSTPQLRLSRAGGLLAQSHGTLRT